MGCTKFRFSDPILRYPDVDQRDKLESLREKLAQLEESTTAESSGDAPAVQKQINELLTIAPAVLVMKEREDRRPAYLLERGNYQNKREEVPPDTPGVLPSFSDDLPRDRLGFAKWLTSKGHPLLARVTVNRIWQRLFGMGLVKTAEDFGVQGEPPSHPKLLDWLSVEFAKSGWDVKHIVRLIVNSATYRQSSTANGNDGDRDPENRLLARGPMKRLSAYAIRDQALWASGLLYEKIGGPPAKPYQPPGFVGRGKQQDRRYDSGDYQYCLLQNKVKGRDLHRRSVYTFWKLSSPPPAMSVFDAPGREVCSVRISRTNTPLQALTLLNDTTFVECANHLAYRMITEGGEAPDDRLQFAFQHLLCRSPLPEEQELMLRAIEHHMNFYKVSPKKAEESLENGEAKYASVLDSVEHAAYGQIALMLLNLNETITLR